MVADEEDGTGRGDVVDSLDAHAEVAVAREAKQVGDERDKLRVAPADVIGAHLTGMSRVAFPRIAGEARHEPRRRQEHPAIGARHQPARATDPVEEVEKGRHGSPLTGQDASGRGWGSVASRATW